MVNIIVASFISFVLGIILTLIFVYIMSMRQLKKLKQEAEKIDKKIKETIKKVKSEANNLIDQLHNVNTKQQQILETLHSPNQGVLHAKHKGELVDEYQKLEVEKINILEDIVYNKKIDETVKINEDGQIKEMKLSEFLKRIKEVAAANNPHYSGYDEDKQLKEFINNLEKSKKKEPVSKNGGVKRHGNFFVIDGGKDSFDDDNGSGGNA